MSTATLRFHFLFVLVILMAPTNSQSDKSNYSQKVAMFVFGDSLFEPGNNNFLVTSDERANFPPYGETFFHYPTGRFCDGRTLPDLAAAYAGLPYWRPYLDPNNHNFTIRANFASAGAGALVETSDNSIPLEIQVNYFKEVANLLENQVGEASAKDLLKEAIYYISIGGVDLASFAVSSSSKTESQIQDFVNMVIGNITDAVKEIYEVGGRKFALQNVAPLGCSPAMKQSYNSTDCVESLQTIAIMHNDALNIVAKELARELPGFKYLIFDFFNILMDRAENPTKYGFKVGDVACCGTGPNRGSATCGSLTTAYELCSDPSEYVYFDFGHPTEACNVQFIEFLWNGMTNVTWPVNMRELIELEIDDTEVSYGKVDLLIDEQVAIDGVYKTYQ